VGLWVQGVTFAASPLTRETTPRLFVRPATPDAPHVPPDVLLDPEIRFWKRGGKDGVADAIPSGRRLGIAAIVSASREMRPLPNYLHLPAREWDRPASESDARPVHPDWRAKERGMSIVEVLVAQALLAFALLGLIPLFVGAVKTAASANRLTVATPRPARPLLPQFLPEQAGTSIPTPALIRWRNSPRTWPRGSRSLPCRPRPPAQLFRPASSSS
jgi:hypothetical protein